MAITEAALTSGSSGADASSFATASISPTANRLIIVAVHSAAVTAANAGPPSGISGAGLTFAALGTAQSDTTFGTALSLWRAMSASPSTGALTITFANPQTAINWSVFELDGIDTSGTNGSGAVNSNTAGNKNAGATASVTATLAAFASANNGAIAATCSLVAGVTIPTCTPDTGWTEIHDTGVADVSISLAIETQWRASNDTTALGTWSTNGGIFTIAAEIIAASSGTSVALTGQSATVSRGTPVPTLDKALTGAAITSAQGSVGPSQSIAGQAATASGGTATPALDKALTGQAITAAGGTATPAVDKSLTGAAATAAGGSVAPDVSVPLSGLAITSAGGTLTPSVAGDVTVALTGLQMTASGGTLTASGADVAVTQGGMWIIHDRKTRTRAEEERRKAEEAQRQAEARLQALEAQRQAVARAKVEAYRLMVARKQEAKRADAVARSEAEEEARRQEALVAERAAEIARIEVLEAQAEEARALAEMRALMLMAEIKRLVREELDEEDTFMLLH
jgi:hypothetical protein